MGGWRPLRGLSRRPTNDHPTARRDLRPDLAAGDAGSHRLADATLNPMTTYRTFVLPDGCIRIWVGNYCGTVSSWHLVEPKVQQLLRLNDVGLQQLH